MTRRDFVMAWRHRFATDPEVKGRCFYCGRTMLFRTARHNPFLQTEEHIVPQWRNPHAAFNRVAACLACNSGKCGADVHKFREWYGKPFFCEEVLREEIPMDSSTAGNGKYQLHYEDLLENCERAMHRHIQVAFHNNSKLDRHLNAIVKEAQARAGMRCRLLSTDEQPL